MNDLSPPNPRPAKAPLPDFTPVPRKCRRHDGWTPERQRAFIEALADCGSVKSAANSVGMTDVGAYQLRRHPEAGGFRKAWEAALKLGVERLEDVAMERALHGVEVPVYHFGEVVGTRRVYNDRLLMFLLRNRAPKRFAADSLHNASASTRSQLKRLKREWRAEWEAERDASGASVAEIQASIERKVNAVRAGIRARTSPRTYELELTTHAQRLADEAAGWLPGEAYEPYAEKAAQLLPQMLEKVRGQWPRMHPALPAPVGKDDADEE